VEVQPVVRGFESETEIEPPGLGAASIRSELHEVTATASGVLDRGLEHESADAE
jgi:hypothetical protein